MSLNSEDSIQYTSEFPRWEELDEALAMPSTFATHRLHDLFCEFKYWSRDRLEDLQTKEKHGGLTDPQQSLKSIFERLKQLTEACFVTAMHSLEGLKPEEEQVLFKAYNVLRSQYILLLPFRDILPGYRPRFFLNETGEPDILAQPPGGVSSDQALAYVHAYLNNPPLNQMAWKYSQRADVFASQPPGLENFIWPSTYLIVCEYIRKLYVKLSSEIKKRDRAKGVDRSFPKWNGRGDMIALRKSVDVIRVHNLASPKKTWGRHDPASQWFLYWVFEMYFRYRSLLPRTEPTFGEDLEKLNTWIIDHWLSPTMTNYLSDLQYHLKSRSAVACGLPALDNLPKGIASTEPDTSKDDEEVNTSVIELSPDELERWSIWFPQLFSREAVVSGLSRRDDLPPGVVSMIKPDTSEDEEHSDVMLHGTFEYQRHLSGNSRWVLPRSMYFRPTDRQKQRSGLLVSWVADEADRAKDELRAWDGPRNDIRDLLSQAVDIIRERAELGCRWTKEEYTDNKSWVTEELRYRWTRNQACRKMSSALRAIYKSFTALFPYLNEFLDHRMFDIKQIEELDDPLSLHLVEEAPGRVPLKALEIEWDAYGFRRRGGRPYEGENHSWPCITHLIDHVDAMHESTRTARSAPEDVQQKIDMVRDRASAAKDALRRHLVDRRESKEPIWSRQDPDAQTLFSEVIDIYMDYYCLRPGFDEESVRPVPMTLRACRLIPTRARLSAWHETHGRLSEVEKEVQAYFHPRDQSVGWLLEWSSFETY